MIKVIDESEAVEASLKRAMSIFLRDSDDILLVNADELRSINEEIRNAKCPVIFYGMKSELALRLEGNPAIPYIHGKNGAYFNIVFELTAIILAYHKIRSGLKHENKAAIMAAAIPSNNRLVSMLLHDIYPNKNGCEEGLKIAEKEFGITGSIEEVRKQLSALNEQPRNYSVKSLAGEEVIPGVFCDVERTLIIDNKINNDLLEKLELYSETKPVNIWTGGDLKSAEKALRKLGVTQYPVLSKYDFEGCKVQLAIDDLSQDDFEQEYKIKAETHIHQIMARD